MLPRSPRTSTSGILIPVSPQAAHSDVNPARSMVGLCSSSTGLRPPVHGSMVPILLSAGTVARRPLLSRSVRRSLVLPFMSLPTRFTLATAVAHSAGPTRTRSWPSQRLRISARSMAGAATMAWVGLRRSTSQTCRFSRYRSQH